MDNQNLFSIGEVAKAAEITRKTILNYEEKGLITPDKKEGVTGNRYYTIDTFTRIRTIRIFQDLGLSLDEICKYFNNDIDLQQIIKRLEAMRDKLNLTIEKLKERTIATNDAIKLIEIDSQKVYCRTYSSGSIADKTNILRDTALEAMRMYGTDITRRMYFIQYNISNPADVTYCVAVPQQSEGEYVDFIQPCKALSFFHHGAYEDIPQSTSKLIEYAKENKIVLSGVFRSIFLEGPPQHKDKSKFITQIVALIKD